MKRYLTFAGDRYYPLGGWEDRRLSYDTKEEAVEAVSGRWDWWHVVDLFTGQVVAQG